MSSKTKTMKVYLYSSKYSDEIVSQHLFKHDTDYVLLAEPSEVTFTMLDKDVVLAKRVEALDAQIKEVRAIAQAKVDDLEDQKQRLLAITHEVS